MATRGCLIHGDLWTWLIELFVTRGKINGQPIEVFNIYNIYSKEIKTEWAKRWSQPLQWKVIIPCYVQTRASSQIQNPSVEREARVYLLLQTAKEYSSGWIHLPRIWFYEQWNIPSYIKIYTPAFIWLVLIWYIYSHPSISKLFIYLYLKWFHCRQRILWSCCFPHNLAVSVL